MIKHPSLLVFYAISCLWFPVQQPGKSPEQEPLTAPAPRLAQAAAAPARPGRTVGFDLSAANKPFISPPFLV